jgi:Tol biopolymer transport system component
VSGISVGNVAWSPSGTQLSYSSTGEDGNSKVFVISAAGGSPRLLTPASYQWGLGWSPDGTSVLGVQFGPENLGGIVSNPVDGSPVRVLVDEPGTWENIAAYSPDGLRLAYITDKHEGRGELYVLDLTSGVPLRLTTTPEGEEWAPAWSPDGSTIVYQVNEGDGDVFVGNVSAVLAPAPPE